MKNGKSEATNTEKLVKALRIFGAFAGAVTGVAILIFFIGYLGQRAQFDIAGLPFVFIDYWAYAEIGMTAIIRSVILVLKSPLVLVLLFLITIAVILLLESKRFRKQICRPLVVVFASLGLLGLSGILLNQQIAVNELRTSEIPLILRDNPEKEDGGNKTGISSRNFKIPSKSEILPAVWPFASGLPPAIELPEKLNSNFGADPLKAWNQIADELESRLSERQYLELRPTPAWISPTEDKNVAATGIIHAASLADGVTPQDRATALYAKILIWLIFCVWCFFVLLAWERYLFNHLKSDKPKAEVGEKLPILVRLREEFWWIIRHITIPMNAVSLIFSGFFLLPESYGALAMPRIGHELVEIVVKRSESSKSAGDSEIANPSNSDEGWATQLLFESQNGDVDPLGQDAQFRFLELSSNYASAEYLHRSSILTSWHEEIDKIQEISSERAVDFLNRVSTMAQFISPELAKIASDAATNLRGEVLVNIQGYILNYPRSKDEKFLRVVLPSNDSGSWKIIPVRFDDIEELRLVSNQNTKQMIVWLREMNRLNEDQRANQSLEMELAGHWALPEVSLCGMYDFASESLSGSSITSTGKYSANLDESDWGKKRRDRILKAMVDHSKTPDNSTNFRSAAATSVHRIARHEDWDSTGMAMMPLIDDESIGKSDQNWVVAGAVLTTLGKMKYKPSSGRMCEIFLNKDVPMHIRATVPTQLAKLDDKPTSIQPLKSFIADPESDRQLVEYAANTLGTLGKNTDVDVIASLETLFHRCVEEEFASAERKDDFLDTILIAMLSPRKHDAIPIFAQILTDRKRYIEKELSEVVVDGAYAFSILSSPKHESLLLDTAEDSEMPARVRVHAVRALDEYRSDHVVESLENLFMNASSELEGEELETLKVSINKCLLHRAEEGSGKARAASDRISRIQISDDSPDIQAFLRAMQERQNESAESPEAELNTIKE